MKNFAEKVAERIMDTNPNVEVRIDEFRKTNSTRIGLAIAEKGNNIAPVIYCDMLKNDCGDDISAAVSMAINLYEKYKIQRINHVEDLISWPDAKRTANVRLVNYEMNKKWLETIAHIKWMDLAIIATVVPNLAMPENTSATITVSNVILEDWGITQDELFEAAISNSNDKAVIKEFNPIPGVVASMTILTNESQRYGAAGLLAFEKLKLMADELEQDLVIIPSTVHECIVQPLEPMKNAAGGTIDELRFKLIDMIQCVNNEHIELEERLGDKPYIYKRDTNIVSLL